ncbi:TetR/AcrR family transcriptional regulator [Streptomyces sp. NBC_00250]|uniref:TetR/AcrR family transcriptional regulator n=1 Tax=Streptomyces sp. NBC_00250 TaxID=2903641 RepID=UPI002E29E60C|nr:TetR/AcrR family transcriptional regulator [Streptomyces sp. NBC_00250]
MYTDSGSRTGLFDALGTDLLHRGGFERMVREVVRPDALEGLRGGIRDNVERYAAHHDVLRTLYSTASLDAEAVGGAVRRMETCRATGMDDLARRLGAQGMLREDVTVTEAGHRLWLLSSFDGFDLLHTGRSLTVDQIAATLIGTAEHALCH